MYSNAPSNKPLPVPVDELLVRPQRIDLRYPPFVPNVRVSEELERYVPLICGVFMEEVQLPVANGPRPGMEARTVFYNLVTYENWHNRECDEALQYVIAYIEAFCMLNDCLRDIEQVIEGEMPKLVAWLVASTIERYSQVEQYYGPAEQDSFIQARRAFHQSQDMIQEFRDRAMQRRGGGGYRDERRDDRGYRDDRGGRSYGRQDRGDDRGDYRSGRGAAAYGERMRQINGGGRRQAEPSYNRRQEQPRANLYAKPPTTLRGVQQSNFDRTPVTNENYRPNLVNPYADMLERRRVRNEAASEELAKAHQAKYGSANVAAKAAQPMERKTTGGTAYRDVVQDQPRDPRPVESTRPNLKRDPAALKSDPLPWEDTASPSTQSNQERTVPTATVLPPKTQNHTPYEVDSRLNADGKLYTIDVNSPFTWVPTPTQWYKPSYHISQIRLLCLDSQGRVLYEVFDKDKPLPELTFFEGQQSVDFLKHIAPNSVSKLHTFQSSDEYRERMKAQIADGVGAEWAKRREMRKDNQIAEDKGEPTVYTETELLNVVKSLYIEPNWAVETSDEAMLAITDIQKRRAVKKTGIPLVGFRNYFMKVQTRVAEDTLSAPEYDDVAIHLDMVKEAEDYHQVALVLDKLRQDPGADPVFVQMVNDRMVAAVNRQLRYSLSVSPRKLSVEGNFDSETVKEVEGLLKKNHGDFVLEQFKSHQHGLLALLFIRDDREEAFNDLYDTEGLEDIKLHHLVSHQSVTLLNMRTSDLGRTIDRDTGSTIDSTSGLLWAILNTLDEKAAIETGEKSAKLYRRLLRTSDGVLLEIHPGHLAKGARILSYAEIDL